MAHRQVVNATFAVVLLIVLVCLVVPTAVHNALLRHRAGRVRVGMTQKEALEALHSPSDVRLVRFVCPRSRMPFYGIVLPEAQYPLERLLRMQLRPNRTCYVTIESNRVTRVVGP